jgi:hypothetical protein
MSFCRRDDDLSEKDNARAVFGLMPGKFQRFIGR